MKHQPVYPDPMRGAEQSIINQSPHQLNEGITKRELFAMAAMQGIINSVFGSLPMYEHQANDWRKKYGEETLVRTAIARDSVEMADELLKQLES